MKQLTILLFTLVLMFMMFGCGPYKRGGPGEPGKDGKDGSSCSVEALSNGSLISCTDGTSSFVSNGADGQDAPPTEFTVVEVINPCGSSGGFDEVLLQLADGSFLAYFAGSGGFLTVLNCGQSYVTTDAEACNFTITPECEYEEISY